MSVATADILKAINAVWDASELDDLFKSLWPSDYAADEWEVLHDGEAEPGQPHPYCVVDETRTTVVERMSDGVNTKRETRDVAVTFHVHAKSVDGDNRTGKQIAADLAEKIMEVFGGHPTVAPTGDLSLDNGSHLITQYDNDYCLRVGDEEFEWILAYNFRLDVPVAVIS